MIKVTKSAFQGDMAIIRREKAPEGFEPQEPSKEVVVAHSETGHHHVALGDNLVHMINPTNPMSSYLVAKGPVVIEHRRPTDTHESYELLYEGPAEVVWEIRRQREHTPEGYRRVED